MKENDIDHNDMFEEFFTVTSPESNEIIKLKTNGNDIKVTQTKTNISIRF